MLTSCLRAADVDRLRPSQQAPLLQACASTLFPGVPTFQMDPSPRGSAPGRQSRKRTLTFLSFPGGGRRLPPDVLRGWPPWKCTSFPRTRGTHCTVTVGVRPKERVRDSEALAQWRLGYMQQRASCQWAAGTKAGHISWALCSPEPPAIQGRNGPNK